MRKNPKIARAAEFRLATADRIVREQIADVLGLNPDGPLGKRIIARVRYN